MADGKRQGPIDRGLIAAAGVLVALVIAAFLLLAIRGGGRDIGQGARQPTSAADLAPPALSVSSAALGQAYAADERAAHKTYYGRRLSVTGVVQGVTLDFTDEPVISLNGAGDTTHVQVSLDKRLGERIARLKPGMIVTVTCDKVVLILGSPMLDECQLGDG